MKKWLSNNVHHAVYVFGFFSLFVILCSGFFNYLSEYIFPNSDWGIYDKSFWVNLLININSSIIDFLFLGLLILYFDRKKESEKEEKILRRDLSDYSFHDTLELNLKKAGILKALTEMKKFKVDVPRLRIHEIELSDIILNDSDMSGLSFYKTKLSNVKFTNCNLRSLNLMEATSKKLYFNDCKIRNLKLSNGVFKSVEFKSCYMGNAKMNNVDLSSAIFNGSDLDGASYDNSNFRSANFLNCKNIDVTKLCQAKCLDYIVAEENIIDEVKRIRPDTKMRRSTDL